VFELDFAYEVNFTTTRKDEMIEHLRIGRTANFYKRKKLLSDNAISQLFTTVRRNTTEPSRNLFREVRTASGEARYSVICFDFARQPSFLTPEADVWERIYGFLLIVEKEDLVAVLKSGLDLPSEFKNSYLEKLAGHLIESAIAQENAVFEKLRLRNMSTSRFALRSKTLEANNLENTVPVSSASRFVPQAYTVSRQDGNYSATPNTGRISNQNERTGLEVIVAWAGEMIDALKAEQGQTAAFIKNFARPVSLSDIPATTHPTFLAFDVGSLKEAFCGEGARYRLVQKQNDGFVEITRQASDAIFDDLDENFAIGPVADEYPILDPEDGSKCGSVAIRKTRVGLPRFTRQLLGEIYVEDLSRDGGEDRTRKLFSRFLDQEDRFVLLFSDLSLAYIEGACFETMRSSRAGRRLWLIFRAGTLWLRRLMRRGTSLRDRQSSTTTRSFALLWMRSRTKPTSCCVTTFPMNGLILSLLIPPLILRPSVSIMRSMVNHRWERPDSTSPFHRQSRTSEE